MAEKDLSLNVDEAESNIITLTDDETGEDKDFEILATGEVNGKEYYALIDTDEKAEEYIILSVTQNGEELVFETIEDDDEFERVEDYFNDLLFGEEDYDN